MDSFASGWTVHVAGCFMFVTAFCLVAQVFLYSRKKTQWFPWLLMEWVMMALIALTLICRGLAVLNHDKLNLMADVLAFQMAVWQSAVLIRRTLEARRERKIGVAVSDANLRDMNRVR